MIPIIVVTSEDPDFSVKTQHPVIEADFAKDICDRCVSCRFGFKFDRQR